MTAGFRVQIKPCSSRRAQNTVPHKQGSDWDTIQKRRVEGHYNDCALVACKFDLEPMLATDNLDRTPPIYRS